MRINVLISMAAIVVGSPSLAVAQQPSAAAGGGWHQMDFEGPCPSCRLAMGGYNLINMGNTAGQQ